MPVYDPEEEGTHSANPGRNPGEEHEKGLESKYDSKALSAGQLRNGEESKNKGWYSAFKNEDNGHTASDVNGGKFGSSSAEPTANGWKPRGASDQVGKGYTSDEKSSDGDSGNKQNWFQRRKKAIATFSLISLLLGGGGAGIIGTASGPFKIIHAGQELRQFHLERQEDQGNTRFAEIARYLREPNKPQNLRLGIVANAYANRIEKNMNRNGIESAYTEKFGYLNGYEIDKTKFKGGQFNDLAGKSDAEVKQYFKNRFNVDVTSRGSGLFVNADDLGYFKNVRFYRAINEGGGYSRITATVRARIMGQRAGISWHPMQKLDKKLLTTAEARYKAWQEKRDARIKNGVQGTDVTTSNDADEKDKGATQNADDTSKGASDVIDTAKGGDVAATNSKISGIMKGAGGAAAAVGLVCLVHGIATNIDNIQQSQVVLPAIRLGMEFVTTAYQIMYGGENGSDVDPEQIGYLADKMDDPKTGFNFFDAKSIQAENGEKAVGPDVDAVMKPGNENPIVAIFGSIPGLGAVCSAATSVPGQIISFGINFIGGPVSAVATEGIFRLVGPSVIDAISHFLAGKAIDPDSLVGAPLGGVANYGVKYGARDVGVSGGGQELPDSDVVSYKQAQDQADKQEFQEKSLAYRLFNPYDHRTLVASIIDKQQTGAAANIASLARGALSFGSSILSVPRNLFVSQTSAATADPYDYGFKDAGFTNAQMNSKAIKNSFINSCVVVGSDRAGCAKSDYPGILSSDKGGDYVKKAQKCFGIALTVDGAVSSDGSVPSTKQLADNDCNGIPSQHCLDSDILANGDPADPSCKESIDWMRIQFYIYDTQLIEGNGCYQGDDQSCTDVNFSGGAAFLPGKSTMGAFA